MEGWIKLHRSLLDWGWFTEPNTLSVFIYLLLIARRESGIWHGISVEMGQAITSRDKIAKATGLSEQQVRTSLERLKSTNEITIKSTNKFTLVTIINYESYQSDGNYQQPANQPTIQPTNNQQITNKQPTIKQESKERDNNININITPISPKTRSDKKFEKPTLEEIQSYVSNQQYHFDAEDFFNYYESKGWCIGKSPMKNWQAACRTWESTWKKNHPNNVDLFSRQEARPTANGLIINGQEYK